MHYLCLPHVPVLLLHIIAFSMFYQSASHVYVLVHIRSLPVLPVFTFCSDPGFHTCSIFMFHQSSLFSHPCGYSCFLHLHQSIILVTSPFPSASPSVIILSFDPHPLPIPFMLYPCCSASDYHILCRGTHQEGETQGSRDKAWNDQTGRR